jgi:hypothetical protein
MHTTLSVLSREIRILLESGDTDRYALVRTNDGDVHWRHDVFGPHDFETGAKPWVDHRGRVTVAQVLAAVPHCEKEILRWTRDELELGADDIVEDIFTRAVRQRALDRLDLELAAALARAA